MGDIVRLSPRDRLNQASVCVEKAGMRGNGVGSETQFGIIRKAALYAGNGPGTVKLFWELYDQGKSG
jgi:hypothetical protein